MTLWMQRFARSATALALLYSVSLPVGAKELEPPAVGEPAPTFTLENADGEAVSLSDFAGKTVVLHWQSCQCPWDVAYQPYLNAMAEKYAEKGVVFLGINSNKGESYETIASYDAGGEGDVIAYDVLKDPGNVVADQYAALTTPHMFVIDGDGILRYRGGIEAVPGGMGDVGLMDEQYLGPVLAALVDGTEPPYTVTKSKGCSVKRAN